MKSILLIDNSIWDRSMLKQHIENLNMPFQVVHECSNGLEALKWLEANKVDLVLTEIDIPFLSGLTLAKRLQDVVNGPEVIIISTHSDFNFLQEALHNGVVDYLLKPVKLNDIEDCLTIWLCNKNNKLKMRYLKSFAQTISNWIEGGRAVDRKKYYNWKQ